MIELTDEQRKALAGGGAVRLQENGQEYVLLRADVYERMTDDDNPLTDAEMDSLAKEAEEILDHDQA
jgi:hypothetical protein